MSLIGRAVLPSLLLLLAFSGSAHADGPALSPTAHPAIEQFVDNADRALQPAEVRRLFALDVANTNRGGNLALFAAASDYAVHELIPPVLVRCGAPQAAAKVRALPKVGMLTRERVQDALSEIGDHVGDEMKLTPRPQSLAFACSNAAPNILSSTGDLLGHFNHAVDEKKQGINQEPEYARFAGGDMAWALKAFSDSGIERSSIVARAEEIVRLFATTARGSAGTAPPKAVPAKAKTAKR